MQDEFIFRGSLLQYWKVIFAQWKRPSASLAEPPFELSAPSLSLPPFAGFVPKENESLVITFYDEKHWEIVSVFADAVLGKNIVKLTLFYGDEVFEKRGESAVARWNKLQKSLERTGLLIDPLAPIQQRVARPKKPAKPKRGSHLYLWFDHYHNMHAVGFKYTFNDIASETSYSVGHIANLHGNYKKERGLA